MALTSDIQPLVVLRAPATPATPTPSTKEPRRNTQTQSSLSRSSPVTRLENSPQSYDSDDTCCRDKAEKCAP